jgi:hypothetical protein
MFPVGEFPVITGIAGRGMQDDPLYGGTKMDKRDE